MSQNNQDYIKKNYAFNFSLLMIDALGFGAAYSMMIPTGFVPDVVNQLTNLWFLPPLIISIFFLGVFFSQFITSAFREKESYAKSDVVKWALGERLAILLLFWSLSPDFSSETQLNLFFLFYSLFIFCAGAILPSYFDMVSRILYKRRSLFFALNVSLSSVTGFALSNYAEGIISSTTIVNGYRESLLLVIIITTFSLVSLLLIREPKDVVKEKKQINFISEINKKFLEWKNIYNSNKEIKYFCIANMICAFPEAISPFYSIWLLDKGFDKSILAQWVALIFVGQGIGSFIVPYLGKVSGFRLTYILGLAFHSFATVLYLLDPIQFHYFIFLFTGIGLGCFLNSLSNIAIELAPTGDAGSINAMLGIFRMPGFVLLPLLVSLFIKDLPIFYIFIAILISCFVSIMLVSRNIDDPIYPQVRFWSTDS